MITDDTLASLRANDVRLDNLFLYLDDYSLPNNEDNGQDNDEDDDTLVAALSGNTHVTAVDCDMHLDTMTDALGKLMTGIGRLVNLQRLRCSSSGDYAVTMAAMAKALYETTTTTSNSSTTSSKLVSLDLANFLLQEASTCEPESLAKTSYQEFVTALQGHATLQNFNLGFGYSSNTTTTPTTTLLETESETNACFTLTPLLQALATAPNLQWVRLDGAGFASPLALTPKGLGAILTSASISTLEVHDFDLSRHHVEAVGQALVTNTSLKVLSLSCHTYTHFGPDEDNASHHPTPSCACSNLSFALCTNTTLEKLYLPHQMLLLDTTTTNNNKQHVDAPLIAFLQALKVNSSLRQVHVTGTSDVSSLSFISQPAEDAFRRMLHHNYTLEAIHMPWFTSDEWQAKIQLYIKLNQLGRGRLVRGGVVVGGGGAATRASSPMGSAALPHQWIEVLGQVQDDVSCLFHLLLLNPLLCDENHHNFLEQ